MLVRIANREDPDQNASSEAVLAGSALFLSKPFCQATIIVFESLIRTFTVILDIRVKEEQSPKL